MTGPNTYIHDNGILLLGETGSEVDYACQVSAITVEPSVDTEDNTPVLCGDDEPGASTYSATANITFFQDLPLPDGLTKASWDHRGERWHFRYFPNAEDMENLAVDGDIIIQPMTIGGDLRSKPTSEVTWDFVGMPTIMDDAVAPAPPDSGNGTRTATTSKTTTASTTTTDKTAAA